MNSTRARNAARWRQARRRQRRSNPKPPQPTRKNHPSLPPLSQQQRRHTVGPGWDIVAISDVAGDFQGSCGKCKEVRCRPANFADGYGQWLERTNVCFNDYSSVVVMVTDTCPCQ